MSHVKESSIRARKRKLVDRWARWIIAAGGFAIIASILAILFFIGVEVVPLFVPADVDLVRSVNTAELLQSDSSENHHPPVAVGVEENREIAYILAADGKINFFSYADNSPVASYRIEELRGENITAVRQSLDGTRLTLGSRGGRVLDVELLFNMTFREGSRSYSPRISVDSLFMIDTEGKRITALARYGEMDSEILSVAAITGSGEVVLYRRLREETIFDEVEISETLHVLDRKWEGNPLTVAVDDRAQNLFLGADDGRIYRWTISDEGLPEFTNSTKPFGEVGVGITALTFLIGDRTLIAGNGRGELAAFSLIRDPSASSGWHLTSIHTMEALGSSITALAPSARGKGFVCGDEEGFLTLQHTTSERTLAEFNLGNGVGVKYASYAPKANGVLTLGSDGRLTMWDVKNPHPEAGFGALFGKVWYEGYGEPDYVWQSSASTDEFEPKLSVVPLIFGSLKGTFYALILSVPLAILAALYTSQFMHPTFKGYVKPTIEIMAALPSVVLGFLAGLWLAPIIEQVVPGVFLMMILLPLAYLISSLLWRAIPITLRSRFKPGVEAAVLIPVSILGVWLSLSLSSQIENLFFEGNFTQWVYDTFLFQYDQRNALIVGFAMGFAVIPIIYTISEDALSNVPSHIISGSLALGATRWQTAVRVVIPTAAAGIFSAVMIGFGRAVGETMIVLMATGNTPIMDWNIFNGFRTLAANIAVEIPEAPRGGTLYRVLFLTAFLLFLITFLVNTVAEIVRHRVREKYQKM